MCPVEATQYACTKMGLSNQADKLLIIVSGVDGIRWHHKESKHVLTDRHGVTERFTDTLAKSSRDQLMRDALLNTIHECCEFDSRRIPTMITGVLSFNCAICFVLCYISKVMIEERSILLSLMKHPPVTQLHLATFQHSLV